MSQVWNARFIDSTISRRVDRCLADCSDISLQKIRCQKKAGPPAGLFSFLMGSVLSNYWAAPTIVHPDRGQVDVLTNAIGSRERTSGNLKRPISGEVDVAVTHEQVVVFKA